MCCSGRCCTADRPQAARSATGVARKPWAGLAGPYSYDKDPWRQGENGNFRREFYRKVLQWLSQPGIKTHNVSEVFVWGMARCARGTGRGGDAACKCHCVHTCCS